MHLGCPSGTLISASTGQPLLVRGNQDVYPIRVSCTVLYQRTQALMYGHQRDRIHALKLGLRLEFILGSRLCSVRGSPHPEETPTRQTLSADERIHVDVHFPFVYPRRTF